MKCLLAVFITPCGYKKPLVEIEWRQHNQRLFHSFSSSKSVDIENREIVLFEGESLHGSCKQGKQSSFFKQGGKPLKHIERYLSLESKERHEIGEEFEVKNE